MKAKKLPGVAGRFSIDRRRGPNERTSHTRSHTLRAPITVSIDPSCCQPGHAVDRLA